MLYYTIMLYNILCYIISYHCILNPGIEASSRKHTRNKPTLNFRGNSNPKMRRQRQARLHRRQVLVFFIVIYFQAAKPSQRPQLSPERKARLCTRACCGRGRSISYERLRSTKTSDRRRILSVGGTRAVCAVTATMLWNY